MYRILWVRIQDVFTAAAKLHGPERERFLVTSRAGDLCWAPK